MQVSYIPYLNMKDRHEVIFSDLHVKVWNYGLMKTTYVADQRLLTKLDTIMNSQLYRGFPNDQPIIDMGIISVNDVDFRDFSPKERDLAREARLRMFAGALVWNTQIMTDVNRGHRMLLSENFDIVWQNFSLDDDHFGIRGGSIIQKNDMGFTLGMYDFKRPQYVMSPMSFNLDEETLSLIAKLYRRNKKLYRRILRALEIVVQAYYNDDKVPEPSRILSMASAFETLFEIPDSGQRAFLKDKTRTMFVLPGDPKRRYKSSRGSGRLVTEYESIKVMWADRFYELRNKIIHGDKMKSDDYNFAKKQRHLDIALLFFAVGLQKIIKEALGISDYTDDVIWQKHVEPGESVDSPFNWEGFVYQDNGLAYVIQTMLERQIQRQSS